MMYYLRIIENKLWFFRGQSDISWELKPKVGRKPYSEINDSQVFNAFKRQAIEYVKKRPKNDWEWLAIAQHHGLATRLLDWSSNPLNAAFFAVEQNVDTDSVIYAVQFKYTADIDNTLPMDQNKLSIFRPYRVVPRITSQNGLFSIHPNPYESVSYNTDGIYKLHRIIIENEFRAILKSELSYYGIN